MSAFRHLSGSLACLLLFGAPAAAQQFEILHAFQAPLADAKAPMVLAADGALYGTLATGGKGGVGAIFVSRPQADGSVVTTSLYQLDRSEGGAVLDALVEGADGWLYGVAPEHGVNGRGTIFKFHRGTAQLVVIHAFSGPDGAKPRGPLVAAGDGNWYGTTTAEGAGGNGTVFRLTPEGVVTTLHAFTDGTAAGLLLEAADGNLYGANGVHIFKLTLAGTRTILHSLPIASPVEPPISFGLVEGTDGHLYGVARPLAPGYVSFFRLTLAGAFDIIYRSLDSVTDGDTATTVPLFVAPDGSLIGTLPTSGPHDRGTLFRLTTAGATGIFTVLHAFTPAEGRSYSGIVPHPNGHVYGTTVEGSLTGHGMIYSVGSGGSIVVRQPFVPILPYAPSAPPVEGPDGALYGTTVAGGVFNVGTFYRLTSSGLTVLHHFSGIGGARPLGKLVLGPDGKFYGTTYDGGGPANRGTIFRISTTGSLETLHTFSTLNGRNPTSGLILASDGSFWGTTLRGGTTDTGTVFKISAGGTFTQMMTFPYLPSVGATTIHPYSGLIEARDGNFYGLANGAPGLVGTTLYRVSVSGGLTRLALLGSSLNAGHVPSNLIEGSDGQLYGGVLLSFFEEHARPAVFRSSLAGAVTTVREMQSAVTALTEGSDHALYGATTAGVLFRLETNGSFTELKALTPLDGVVPSGVRTAGDWIMGSAYGGGPGNGGVIFRFRRD